MRRVGGEAGKGRLSNPRTFVRDHLHVRRIHPTSFSAQMAVPAQRLVRNTDGEVAWEVKGLEAIQSVSVRAGLEPMS